MATSTNYTNVSYIEEAVGGTTPASPAFKLLPTTGGQITSNITTAVSEVIRSDRQTDDLVIVDSSVSGELNYELSYAPYKELLTALMQNDTITVDSDLGLTSATTVVAGTDNLSYASLETILAVNSVVELTSATDPDIDGEYTVTALGTGAVTVTPTPASAQTDVVIGGALDILPAEGAVANGSGTPSKIELAGIEGEINVGDVFWVTSATDAASIDGTYTCINNSTADEISITPAFGDTAASIATDLHIRSARIITNGADDPKSYTFRTKAIESGTPYYWYARGCKVNTASMNFATGSILNGNIGVIGRTEEATETAISGESEVATPAYSIMNSVSSVGTVYLEGLTLGTCSFSSLDLSIDNQINEAKSIGVLGACDTAAFSLQITGNVEIYFKDLTTYNKFLNSESFAVTIILTDGDNKSIGISMPKCKFETLTTPISGKDAFLMQSGSFRALRDATDDYMMKLSFAR